MTTVGCLMMALWTSAFQAKEMRQEHWPNGKLKADYEVSRNHSGTEVKSGSFTAWFPSGAKQAEGVYADDLETGRWTFYRDGGGLESKGSFARGQRTATWETFHANGQRASKGKYTKGMREGEWLFWGVVGAQDPVNSGAYEPFESHVADGSRLVRGELLDGQRHGTWTSYWPNLDPQLVARFVRGKRAGQWVFHHQDGSISTTILSGIYADDRWVSPLPPEVVTAAPALRDTPAPEPAPAVFAPIVTAEWEEKIRSILAIGDKEADELVKSIAGGFQPMHDVAAMPFVIARLLALDVEKPEDRRTLVRLDGVILSSICRGRGLGSLGRQGPPDAAGARERVRSWASAWAVMRSDPWFWQCDLRLGDPPATLAPPRQWLQEPDVFGKPERPVPALFALRSEGRRLLSKKHPAMEQCVFAALEWLKAHQSEDGLWYSNGFENECGDLGANACSGVGNHYDVGVSALALLAFMGDGSSLHGGAYQDVVSRGVTALLGCQDVKTGRLQTTWDETEKGGQHARYFHTGWLHEHGFATSVLCEALATHESTLLRSRTEQAVRVILDAQNAYAGWRYAFPPDGSNDTAMTGEMLFALRLAREAGIAADYATANANGLSILDQLTDPATGRTGYMAMGEWPARLPNTLAQFPPEKGESATAVALAARLFAGRTLDNDISIAKGANLLVMKLPTWDSDRGTIDLYYWHFGSLVLHQVGGPLLDKWSESLYTALVDQQCSERSRDSFGSWEPIDAWSSQGGRVYSTAVAALCLEAGYRYARILAEQDRGAPTSRKK